MVKLCVVSWVMLAGHSPAILATELSSNQGGCCRLSDKGICSSSSCPRASVQLWAAISKQFQADWQQAYQIFPHELATRRQTLGHGQGCSCEVPTAAARQQPCCTNLALFKQSGVLAQHCSYDCRLLMIATVAGHTCSTGWPLCSCPCSKHGAARTNNSGSSTRQRSIVVNDVFAPLSNWLEDKASVTGFIVRKKPYGKAVTATMLAVCKKQKQCGKRCSILHMLVQPVLLYSWIVALSRCRD